MDKGTVYFFTGLAGAGKTTVGGLFFRRLKATKPNAVLLDGDQIRPVFCEDTGYRRGLLFNRHVCRRARLEPGKHYQL